MADSLTESLGRFGWKRLIALALAPGFVALAFDVAADHLADQTVEHPAQVAGAVTPVLCALLLLACSLPRLSPQGFRRATWTTAGLSLVTGLVGTWFHVVSVVELLEGDYAWGTLLETLTVSPPVFAPLAFVGLAVLLVALGNERVSIAVTSKTQASQTASSAAA